MLACRYGCGCADDSCVCVVAGECSRHHLPALRCPHPSLPRTFLQPNAPVQHSPQQQRELQLRGEGFPEPSEETNAAQRRRLKQLHWDKLKQVGPRRDWAVVCACRQEQSVGFVWWHGTSGWPV